MAPVILPSSFTRAFAEVPKRAWESGLASMPLSTDAVQNSPELENALDGTEPEVCHIVNKPTFGSYMLPSEILDELMAHNKAVDDIEKIVIYGYCTDICVISNALLLRAYLPEIPIIVDAACCAGVTPESHRTALAAMRACQIIIENEPSI